MQAAQVLINPLRLVVKVQNAEPSIEFLSLSQPKVSSDLTVRCLRLAEKCQATADLLFVTRNGNRHIIFI
jgi:hypothetical protein